MTPSAGVPLTFAGTGWMEAEAQIGLAAIMCDDLVLSLRERKDGHRDLKDRVREVHEVLVAAVSAMNGTGGGDRAVRDADCFLVRHDDSPSVGGSDASTVGAPGGAPTVAPPGTWLISPNPSAYVAHVVRPDGRGRSMCGLVTPRGGWTSAETPLHCASCERALAAS